MLCKVCNTRIAKGRNACPNCGSNAILKTPARASRKAAALPHIDYEANPVAEETTLEEVVVEEVAAAESVESSPTAEVVEMVEEAPEVELNEPAEVELNEPAEVGDPRAAAAASTREEKDDPPMTATASIGTTPGLPDADALRAMLAQQPDLLEPGLTIYTSEKGTPQGVGYVSAVGEIDLLAWDAQGGLVVVMIAGAEDGAELISGVLQRIGWVSKHVSGKGQGVRGIVLLESVHDSIAYAAAAVSETVSFKTWRLALVFNDVEF
jgi:hypothetical protein